MTQEIDQKVYKVLKDLSVGLITKDLAFDVIHQTMCLYVDSVAKPDHSTTEPDKLIAEMRKQERANLRNEMKNELDKILDYMFNHLDNTQTKLVKSKDKDIQFNIGFNEGTYTAVKEVKNLLSELWQNTIQKLVGAKKPKQPDGVVSVSAGWANNSMFWGGPGAGTTGPIGTAGPNISFNNPEPVDR